MKEINNNGKITLMKSLKNIDKKLLKSSYFTGICPSIKKYFEDLILAIKSLLKIIIK